MTHSEFDQLTFSEKLPFRVIEALRQVLVHEIPAGDAIRNCGIKDVDAFKRILDDINS